MVNENELTYDEFKKKLNDLFNRIIDSEASDYDLCEDIRYVGHCEGVLSLCGDLSKEMMVKLNQLWKKYKKQKHRKLA